MLFSLPAYQRQQRCDSTWHLEMLDLGVNCIWISLVCISKKEQRMRYLECEETNLDEMELDLLVGCGLAVWGWRCIDNRISQPPSVLTSLLSLFMWAFWSPCCVCVSMGLNQKFWKLYQLVSVSFFFIGGEILLYLKMLHLKILKNGGCKLLIWCWEVVLKLSVSAWEIRTLWHCAKALHFTVNYRELLVANNY